MDEPVLKNFKKTHKTHSKFLCEFRIVPLIIVILLANTGCVGLGIATVTTAGIVYSQERSSGRAVTDTKIRVELNAAVVTYSEKLYHSIKLAVVEGRVLITGTIPSRKERNILIDIIRYTEGVEEVIGLLAIDETHRIILDHDVRDNICYTFDVSNNISYANKLIHILRNSHAVNNPIMYDKSVIDKQNIASCKYGSDDLFGNYYGKQASRQIKMRNSLSIKVATEGNLSSILTL
jgi:hypothetical protein